jgi:cytochrome c oxidase subunit 2
MLRIPGALPSRGRCRSGPVSECKSPLARAAKPLLVLAVVLALLGCQPTPGADEKGPADVTIRVVMKQFEIVPARIVVRRGQLVDLLVTSADVKHGIAIPRLHVRERVRPGAVTRVRFRALEPGDYSMSCNVQCGRDHDRMTGRIVVE